MNTTSLQKVMYGSPEAAEFKAVTGWVSRDGRFYGDNEHLARWAGCTHKVCACGNEMTKGYLACDVCRDKATNELWEKLPLVEWDGKTPFCLDYGEDYFFDVDDFYDWCEEHEQPPWKVRLVLAEPRYFYTIDGDIWADIIPEDGDLPDVIQEALDALNAAIKAHKNPASWMPSQKRIVMKAKP